MNNKIYIIGVMTGTSMDGADVCLVEFDKYNQKHLKTIHSKCYPMKENLKNSLLKITTGKPTTLKNLGYLDIEFAEYIAECCNQFLNNFSINHKDITAISSHGQTIWHEPYGKHPFTMQIGKPVVIAQRTQISVIADFRSRDIAYGGQGAPLIPLFHDQVLRTKTENRILLNIGGISNITVLITNQPTIGYDTGTGSVLMDSWVKEKFNLDYDKNGELASQGTVNKNLLNIMLQNNYFKLPPPKSTGRELFNLKWLHKILKNISKIDDKDVLSTLLEFTALTIANAINQYQKVENLHVYTHGGGKNNQHLMKRIETLLTNIPLKTTNHLNINGDFMESIAFAWLGYQFLNNNSLPTKKITGSAKNSILGVIFPP